MASNGKRATNQVIYLELLNLKGLVEQHISNDERRFDKLDNLLLGVDDKPGLKGRLDRLEQTENRRSGHIKALWGSLIALVCAWVFGKVAP